MKNLLGHPSDDIFITWKNIDISRGIADDVMIRISHLLGIHAALKILLNEASAHE